MVGGATNQPPQLAPLASPPPSSATAMTEEDEFLKRNTDCVYFLASPLTCKKGSECEYRHSDIARVNPRDCWYWLNGNCLNPKCAFRHPPLDGLLGAEVPTPVAHSIPQDPVISAKQGVACIFFQQGFCLKGHLCPFLHGPPTVVNNKLVRSMPPNSVTKPSKVSNVGPEKSIQQQNLTQQESIQKPVEFLPPEGKYVAGMQAKNGGSSVMVKKVAPPPEEPPRYKPADVGLPLVTSEFQASRSNHSVYETNHVSDNEGNNGKDADEYSREPTPGFDVLVDTEVGDSEYYPNEEQFGRTRGQDFDMGRSNDFDIDRDTYPDQRDYDHYNKEGYAWEDHRDSSNYGRKRYPRDESPDQFNQSDLRHQISKQRRGSNAGGLGSVVSREHPRDIHADRMPRRDSHHDHQNRHLEPGSLSSRLRGRIKIPGRSTSPRNGNESRVEREFDMGRQYRSRYSPGRLPHVSSNHSRLRDRIKGNDYNYEKRNYRGSRGSDNDSEFTGHRRLSELKSRQTDDGQSLGKRKYPRTESQQSEVNLSFEGPKPLSEILKRKRGSVICVVNNEDSNINENNQKETNEKSMDRQASLNNVENNGGFVDGDAMLDQELEADDHRDGDYYYDEQINGEEYNLEEGEEYMYEEEGDETGKKENEVYS